MTDPSFFHRPPLAHQLRDFERFKDAPYFALFYQQRARKTKVVLDVFRYRYARGEVDMLLVIAYPNGVHRVWLDELPKDLPPDELSRVRSLAWKSGYTTGSAARRADALSIRDHDGPIVVTMNCEALKSKKAWEYIVWLLRRRRAFIVADEASWAANWNARTRKLLVLGGFYRKEAVPNVVVKAILDGTPVDEGPSDVYYPTTFLHRGALGFTSVDSFRARYLLYEMEELKSDDGAILHDAEGRPIMVRKKTITRTNLNGFETVIGVQNMDELHARLQAIGSRVLRREVSDSPPKTYRNRYFDLTDRQRRVYDEARSRYIVDLAHGQVSLREVLLRMIRLQMIARNYYPAEDRAVACADCIGLGWGVDGTECPRCGGEGVVRVQTQLQRIDESVNPALETLLEEVEAARQPTVIWCCFKQDVSDVVAALGPRAGRYDGSVPEVDRERAYQRFKVADGLDHIVGTITSGLSRGKDLTRADALIYYSNVFSRRARSQSEDRAEGLDKRESTGVIDLLAGDTRDLEIVAALQEKRDLAAEIMGDPLHLL